MESNKEVRMENESVKRVFEFDPVGSSDRPRGRGGKELS